MYREGVQDTYKFIVHKLIKMRSVSMLTIISLYLSIKYITCVMEEVERFRFTNWALKRTSSSIGRFFRA